MKKVVAQTPVDGYGSGELDFLGRLQSAPEAFAAVQSEIVQPLVQVLTTDGQTAVMTVTGHSDRVDDPGLSREQRRIKELEASQARAQSAVNGVLELIRSAGVEVPDNFEELQQLEIADRGAGAAVLREFSDALGEDQRKRNRRVQIRVIRFEPL